jgi:hypothetical protein
LIYERLREHWATFCAVADGSSGIEDLPTWQKTKPKPTGYGGGETKPASKNSTGFDDMDDDIPF